MPRPILQRSKKTSGKYNWKAPQTGWDAPKIGEKGQGLGRSKKQRREIRRGKSDPEVVKLLT